MCPTALVLSWEVVVCSIEVGHQRARDLCAEYPTGYSPRSAPVVLVEALTIGCGKEPDIAILTSLPPYGLICVHDWAVAHALLYLVLSLEHSRGFGYSVQQAGD